MSSASALDAGAWAQGLGVLVLLCARLLPLCWLAPFAAARPLPRVAAFSVLVVLALCLWPIAHANAAALPTAALAWLALSLREALIGLVYALALALPLRAFEWGGSIAGRLAQLPGSDAIYARLQLWLGVAAFFALGGHRVVLSALALDLSRRPLGAVAAWPDLAALSLSSAQLMADAFAAAVLLALPVAAAFGFAELGVALALRTTPNLHVALLPARAALGLFMFAVCALLTLSLAPGQLDAGLRAAQRAWGGP